MVEVFKKISSINIKEDICDIYIYNDTILETYTIFYNDEIKFPINLEKIYRKKVGKVKNFYSTVIDIKVGFDIEKDLIQFVFYENFID